MRRLIFLNQYFFPDESAASQILSDLAFQLVDEYEVHVITSRQLYNDPKSNLSKEESIAGVHVHRVTTFTFGRSNLLGRAVDYISFYLLSFAVALRVTQEGDIVIAKTNPPLISIVATYATLLRRAVLINWLQDVYPEVAIQLRMRFVRGLLGRELMVARDWSLKMASANVVLGDNMAAYIAGRTGNTTRVKTIPNWNATAIGPIAHDLNPLRHQWDLQDKFVVGYSGNLGRAHEVETILRAADLLKSDHRIAFLFVGGGHHIERVRREVQRLGISDRFIFKPYQERANLSCSLSVADVHWVSLRPELEGLIVPSKFYGIAGVGRPTIAVTAKDGEIARLVERYDCGLQVDPGDGVGFAEAIVRLAKDPELCVRLGANARRMMETEFSRLSAFQSWKTILGSREIAGQ